MLLVGGAVAVVGGGFAVLPLLAPRVFDFAGAPQRDRSARLPRGFADVSRLHFAVGGASVAGDHVAVVALLGGLEHAVAADLERRLGARSAFGGAGATGFHSAAVGRPPIARDRVAVIPSPARLD